MQSDHLQAYTLEELFGPTSKEIMMGATKIMKPSNGLRRMVAKIRPSTPPIAHQRNTTTTHLRYDEAAEANLLSIISHPDGFEIFTDGH